MALSYLVRIARMVGVAAVLAAPLPPVVAASIEEESKLAEAQASIEATSGEIAELSIEKAAAQKRVAAARRLASRLGTVADDAKTDVAALADAVDARRKAAANEVREAEAVYRREIDDWRGQRGWLLAGAVFLALLALAGGLWPALLRWQAVTWLLERPRWGRVAVVLMAALVGLGLLGSSSTGGTLVGGALLGTSAAFGLLLLLLARARSLEAAGERSSKQGAEPTRPVRLGFSALVAAGAATLLVLAIGLEKPAPRAIPEGTLVLARAGDSLDNPTSELETLQEAAESNRRRADAADARLTRAKSVLTRINARLRTSHRSFDRAQRRVDRWEAALAKPDPRPKPVEPVDPESAGCDPGYSGCVPPYPPDVDCADVTGSVEVYGSDPHGLDADGDGIGCE